MVVGGAEEFALQRRCRLDDAPGRFSSASWQEVGDDLQLAEVAGKNHHLPRDAAWRAMPPNSSLAEIRYFMRTKPFSASHFSAGN